MALRTILVTFVVYKLKTGKDDLISKCVDQNHVFSLVLKQQVYTEDPIRTNFLFLRSRSKSLPA